jgi:hypothetical protein
MSSLSAHPRLRSLLACASIALPVIGISTCGGSRHAENGGGMAKSASRSPTAAELSKHDDDGDLDTFGAGPYDNDRDAAVPTFGPAAGTADRRAIVSLIRRYYEAAVIGDGARACSMLDPLVIETVLEEHRRGKGPGWLQGSTCKQVMSKLFAQRHHELAEDVASFRVSVVQLHGRRGLVLLPFAVTREVEVIMRRDQGVWKMDVPLDNGVQ